MVMNRRILTLVLYVGLSACAWAGGSRPACEIRVEPKQLTWEERRQHVYARVFDTRLIIPGGFMAVGGAFGLVYFKNYEHEYPHEGSIQIGEFDSENPVEEAFAYLESEGIDVCRLRGLGRDDLYVAVRHKKSDKTGLDFYSARIFNEHEHILITADTPDFWKEVMSGLLVQ